MTKTTLRRHLKRLQNGEDITKKPKRGRKPKYSHALLKKLSTDLCFKNKTLREEANALHNQNLENVAQEALPVVSKSTIHRYVTDSSLAAENDMEVLTFTQCTVRGPNSNSPQNKELRIARRVELDQYIRGGFKVVFVDESHWSVGNVRTRKWGEKGKKNIRTQSLTRFNLSCICAISVAGEKHCRLFNRTITGDIFKAYLRELMNLFTVQNDNVVFVMDNAPIHKVEIEQLAEENNHAILFNAPYSPDCNPIENVFGFWKSRVDKLVNVDIADMITNIARCFEEITPAEIRGTINHFLLDVTPRSMHVKTFKRLWFWLSDKSLNIDSENDFIRAKSDFLIFIVCHDFGTGFHDYGTGCHDFGTRFSQ